MGVYIKGMEMPQSCGQCPFKKLSPTGESMICELTLFTVPWDWKTTDCPLVPVPDHGRRVVYRGEVYNAIEEKRIKTLDRVLNDRYIDGMHDGLKQALFALATVEDAPTIIPAEEGET